MGIASVLVKQIILVSYVRSKSKVFPVFLAVSYDAKGVF